MISAACESIQVGKKGEFGLKDKVQKTQKEIVTQAQGGPIAIERIKLCNAEVW